MVLRSDKPADVARPSLLLNLLFACTERLVQRHLLAVSAVDVSKPGLMLLNNGIGLPLTAVAAGFVKHEYARTLHALAKPRQLLLVLLSALVGIGISYTGLWLQKLVTATSFMVLGAFCKIALMVVACLFACGAQFNPVPFPKVRPVLGVCCSGYFIFSGIHQLVVRFVERDIVFVSKAKGAAKHGIRLRTDFPKFQDLFTVIVEYDAPGATQSLEEKHCVGKFFDTNGFFWEQGYCETVQKLVEKFESKKKD